MKNFLLKYSINLIFIIGIFGIICTFYFEHILNLYVCDLCWYERILFYPLPILAIIALLIKDNKVFYYTAFFSFLGTILAFYHHLLKVTNFVKSSFGICTNTIESCSNLEWELIKGSNITIPLLASIGFFIIFLLSVFKIYKN